MDRESKAYNIFYNQPQGTRVRGRLKNRWMDCVLSGIKNAILGTWRSSQGIEGYGGGPLWRQRPALGIVPMKKKQEKCLDSMCLHVCMCLNSTRKPLHCSPTSESYHVFLFLFSCNCQESIFNLYSVFNSFSDAWGPFLIISPASTLHNWQQEMDRFVPDFKVVPYWGSPQVWFTVTQ